MIKITPDQLPDVRGRYTENAPLGVKGWFRCGGTADVLFKPADIEDLQYFLKNYNPSTPHPTSDKAQAPNPTYPSPLSKGGCVGGGGESSSPDIHIFGALSNTIIRDGGVRGVVIRLGREFSHIKIDGDRVIAGALALDANVANIAAENGIGGLEFLSGIPGSLGGAVKMNAGCYGTEIKDVFVEATVINRYGQIRTVVPRHSGEGQNLETVKQQDPDLRQDDVQYLDMTYRHTNLTDGDIVTRVVLQGHREDTETVKNCIINIKEKRELSQPIREKTGGSTFANPSPAELSQAGLNEDMKVWQLIESVGGRGLKIGGAQMSEKHCNFMINTGDATASDLEALGEEIRARVLDKYGITLRWEIRRIGEA